MKLKEAIEILRYHNLWRRGDAQNMLYTPKEIGEAIDKIIHTYESKYRKLQSVNN